jgi:hypothetical protein
MIMGYHRFHLLVYIVQRTWENSSRKMDGHRSIHISTSWLERLAVPHMSSKVTP